MTATSFAVPEHALGYWVKRFTDHGVAFEKPATRFDGESLVFSDPDGLQLELVAHRDAEGIAPWQDGPVPGEYAVRGFYGVTLAEASAERTASVLEVMGWRLIAEAGDRLQFQMGDGGLGARVDVVCLPHEKPGRVAVGTVHHVAYRTPDDVQQLAWRQAMLSRGLNVSPVMDRQYFHSIYFREPGGVLFEIATDPPGFGVDEAMDQLGTCLMLPPWLEPARADIERNLPSSLAANGRTSMSVSPAELYVHRFIPARDAGAAALLLLHGMGGDESDMIPLARTLAPDAALLSLRGKVLENGLPRFFRRLPGNVFDVEDLKFRAQELAEFVQGASASYQFDPGNVVAVGFSNGANMAAAILLLQPGLLRAAILFCPSVPLVPECNPVLAGKSIFVGAGRADPIVAPQETERLVALLRDAGADVTAQWHPGGHLVSNGQVEAARDWLSRILRSEKEYVER